MTERNDLLHKLVNDVYAELGTISKHSQDVIDYLMCHGWIRTPEEAEAAARGETPGLTITESRKRELDLQWRTDLNYSFDDLITDLGITVVPDPEPTEAEKLAEDLMQADAGGGHVYRDGYYGVAKHLADLGWTKAPGGRR